MQGLHCGPITLNELQISSCRVDENSVDPDKLAYLDPHCFWCKEH